MLVEGRGRGAQQLHRFDNGYGASVITDGYGSHSGLMEVAVLVWDGDSYEITYDTPVTSDVLGYLTQDEVTKTLGDIAALKQADIVAAKIAARRARIAEHESDVAVLVAEIAALEAEIV